MFDSQGLRTGARGSFARAQLHDGFEFMGFLFLDIYVSQPAIIAFFLEAYQIASRLQTDRLREGALPDELVINKDGDAIGGLCVMARAPK
jgi:hypothetical protein